MASAANGTRLSAWGLAATLLASSALAQTNLRDRVQGAVDAVESICAADISRFCGNVSRGEGRLLLCLEAFDDQLSRRCQFGLYRASRNLEGSLNRVERIADACWSDIEANCPNADRIGQCLSEKLASVSPGCRSAVDAVQQTLANLPSLRGLPVLSSDNEEVGRVVEVVRDQDGRLQALKIDIGSFLGVGGRTINIDVNSFEQVGDKIRLQLSGDSVRSAPRASQQ
jgi:sporulation protein YlmC with PRC-barrel domain